VACPDDCVASARLRDREYQLASLVLTLARYSKDQAKDKARDLFPDKTWKDVVAMSVAHMQGTH